MSLYSAPVWLTGQGSQRIDQYSREEATRLILGRMAEIRPASTYAAGQISRFAENLPSPEGRLHFAGEHTRRREFGMESAMASAERVIGEILQVA
jgi:hypothetical protein